MHWFTNVPALNGIGDAIKQDNELLQTQAATTHLPNTNDDPNVTFTKMKVATEEEIIANETEQEIFSYIRMIQAKFSVTEVEKVIDILNALTEQKQNIELVYDLLEIKTIDAEN